MSGDFYSYGNADLVRELREAYATSDRRFCLHADLLARAAAALDGLPGPNDLQEAMEILRSIQFTTVLYSKCPVCLGFEMPHGEQSRHHRKDCRLDALLKRHPATNDEGSK